MTAVAANRDQAEAWNGISGQRWAATADQRDQVLAPVAEALLAQAAPATGERVLDIGCGCGATTIAGAEAAGTAGAALGIDLSEPMLGIARRRALAVNVANATFVEADGQTHSFAPAGADLAISRFGTMFFDDPIAAFSNIGAGLADGGRLVIATWQPLAANEWLLVPGAILLRYTGLPDDETGATGMFAQSDPQAIVNLLEAAGFRDVDPEPIEVRFTLGRTTEEAAAYLAESGPGRTLLDTIEDPEHRQGALDAVTAELDAHRVTDGVHLAAGILVTTARWHR